MKKWCVGWGPVPKCNMHCDFCYSKNVRDEKEQLGLSDWIDFVDKNNVYIENINYGTGENSLCKDWFLLLKHIHETAPLINQAVTTNGYLSEAIKNDTSLENIINTSISEIDISLDYFDKSKHNQFRGQKEAYQWAINTLKMFSKSNKSLTIVVLGTNDTLTPMNLNGLMNIAHQYGAKLRINLYRPTMGINNHSKRFIPLYSTVLDAIKFLSKNYHTLSISDPLFSSILVKNSSEHKMDPSGHKSIRILHNGDITPSTYLISEPFRKSNIKEGKILDSLDKRMEQFTLSIPEKCLNCTYVDTCKGGVFDRRYLWYNTFDEPDPFCPFRNENYVPDFEAIIDKSQTFSSIHEDYLPTMFFAP